MGRQPEGYACMHACMSFMSTCVCVCMFVCMHDDVHVCVHVCMDSCMCVSVYSTVYLLCTVYLLPYWLLFFSFRALSLRRVLRKSLKVPKVLRKGLKVPKVPKVLNVMENRQPRTISFRIVSVSMDQMRLSQKLAAPPWKILQRRNGKAQLPRKC